MAVLGDSCSGGESERCDERCELGRRVGVEVGGGVGVELLERVEGLLEGLFRRGVDSGCESARGMRPFKAEMGGLGGLGAVSPSK